MVSANQYYEVIEEIRLAKSMPVTELCQDIISERTYYRNLHSQGHIRFDILSKLSKRLGVSAEQLIHYAVFVRKGDPSITRFMYRVHLHYFDDIEPIYEKVKHHTGLGESYALLTNAFISKYESLVGIISRREYEELLHGYAQRALAINDIFLSSVLSLYAVEIKQQTLVDINRLLDYFIAYDYKTGLIFYLNTVDLLLDFALDNSCVDLLRYKDALKHYGDALTFFPHKYYHTKYALYKAYLYRLEEDLEGSDKALYHYLMGINVLLGNELYLKAITRVESVFKKDVRQFMIQKSMEMLKLAPFDIVNKSTV